MPKKKVVKSTHYDIYAIKHEFLKYAPGYALVEAEEALEYIMQLQSQGLLRNGIYYIVLVDLVGSTKFSAEYGNSEMAIRVRAFVTASFQSLPMSRISNTGIFLKEIGDAVLYVFQHFPDILKWRHNFQRILDSSPTAKIPYILRTCIHIGEISLDGVNPISLAVSQTFKMEKDVPAGEIGLTDPAFHVAWPTIARAYYGFTDIGVIELDGYKEKVKLHKLNIHDKDDLERIIAENEENL